MPLRNGAVEATREIAAASPRTYGVVVLTMFDDDESLIAALRAGARRLPPEGLRAGRNHPRHLQCRER